MAEQLGSNYYNTPYKFNGKELDEETGLYYYGARYYDPRVSIWLSVDPLAEKYPNTSPYTYCNNNPINMIDPTGMSSEPPSDFYDKSGNLVNHVDDGSNAVYKQNGKGVNLHYEFTGYDEKQGGKNVVNLTTAIQEQQKLNIDNPSLQQFANGPNDRDTHCNQATQCILNTVASATNNPSVKINGNANTMMGTLNNGDNNNFIKVDQKTAETNAKNGGLSIVGVIEPGHGHILTYSTGENISKGQVSNIGPKKYSGFTSLNGSISKKKEKTFYILKK